MTGSTRWIFDQGVPRFSSSGEFLGYIGSCVDVTERKQAETEREKFAEEQTARATAEAASRSKDEFLAMVSHELRSPLSAILGYAQLLRVGPVDIDGINRVVTVIERNAKAQIQIIEDLLDSARITTGKLRIELALIDLVPVLEAGGRHRPSGGFGERRHARPRLRTEAHRSIGRSGAFLQQIVWNLLTNAIKFTPEGGRVSLAMKHDAGQIRIIVGDTGQGIEPGFLPFRLPTLSVRPIASERRDGFGGLGLGLSLAKDLVELHGGTISAKSEGVGRGATFTVTFPARQSKFVMSSPTEDSSADILSDRPSKILRTKVRRHGLERSQVKSALGTAVRGLRRRPPHEVDVPEVAGASVRIDHKAEDVRTGTHRNAGDEDRRPRLPIAGVRHRNGTRHVDAVNFDMTGAAGP